MVIKKLTKEQLIKRWRSAIIFRIYLNNDNEKCITFISKYFQSAENGKFCTREYKILDSRRNKKHVTLKEYCEWGTLYGLNNLLKKYSYELDLEKYYDEEDPEYYIDNDIEPWEMLEIINGILKVSNHYFLSYFDVDESVPCGNYIWNYTSFIE